MFNSNELLMLFYMLALGDHGTVHYCFTCGYSLQTLLFTLSLR